jgi:hypothetical protein
MRTGEKRFLVYSRGKRGTDFEAYDRALRYAKNTANRTHATMVLMPNETLTAWHVLPITSCEWIPDSAEIYDPVTLGAS